MSIVMFLCSEHVAQQLWRTLCPTICYEFVLFNSGYTHIPFVEVIDSEEKNFYNLGVFGSGESRSLSLSKSYPARSMKHSAQP